MGHFSVLDGPMTSRQIPTLINLALAFKYLIDSAKSCTRTRLGINLLERAVCFVGTRPSTTFWRDRLTAPQRN